MKEKYLFGECASDLVHRASPLDRYIAVALPIIQSPCNVMGERHIFLVPYSFDMEIGFSAFSTHLTFLLILPE